MSSMSSIAISSVGLSGMNAAQTSMSASAFNIANLGGDGFRREQVQQRTASPAGVTATVDHATTPGEDVGTDLVGMLQAKNDFLANLALYKTGDKVTGALLNALG